MTWSRPPAELAATFAKVERELSLTDPDATLELLAQAAVDMVPGAQMAGITVGKKGGFVTAAATTAAVAAVDRIQYQLRSGPCVDAILEQTMFNAEDLRTDGRWPEFGHRAFEQAAVISMLSFRLFVEDDVDLVAGLNMYSRHVAAFDGDSESIGLLLATHGALAVANAAARRKAQNLLVALKTSREIGVAIGILMQRYKINRDDAFSLLRLASQGLHRKLSAIAASVAETGELPELPAHHPSPGVNEQ